MNTSRLALFVLTVGLLCVGTAVGQDEKRAESDADVVAFEATLSKAEDGNVAAMNDLGVMYANGEGMLEDHKEAVKWHRKAAELGDAVAMRNLGLMFTRGTGVAQDDVEAYAWLNAAVTRGCSEATHLLGLSKQLLLQSKLRKDRHGLAK